MAFFRQLHLSSRTLISFGFFFLIIFVAYSNSFHASWHFDDYHTIVNNPKLKINDLKFSTLQNTFRSWSAKGAYNSDRLYRPVPNLTFGLNWYFWKNDVFGYHLVNVFIHYLTACVLYLIIANLFQTPRLKNHYLTNRNFIPFMAALLWAVNPIQTQAVTYIVQRMAAMAAMFFLIGIFCYIKGRLKVDSVTISVIYFILAGFCFFLAVLSKQNTVLWPLSIGLIEITFFQDLNLRQSKALIIGILLCFLIVIISVCIVFLINEKIYDIQKMYASRPFTQYERLLTEFRVLIYYLSLIIYPIPQRLSIEHDFIVSSSMFQPWTTLPCIFLVLGLIGGSVVNIKKDPIISFAILFFFINHIIESSVIGLELIFEHRNYLPSAFLFFPVAVAFHRLISLYDKQNKVIHTLILSTLAFIILGFIAGTLTRNRVWMTEKTLWEDALQKAPASSRPYHNLAWAHYEKIGDYQKALGCYREALKREVHHNLTRSALLGNIAAIHYKNQNYQRAIHTWNEALAIDTKDEINRYGLACALLKINDYPSAFETFNILTRNRNKNPVFWGLKGFLLLKMKRYDEAEQSLDRSLSLNSDYEASLINKGACQNLRGDYRDAESILKEVYRKMPYHKVLLLWLIDTNLKLLDVTEARLYLDKLLEQIDEDRLPEFIKSQPEDDFIIFPDSKNLQEKILGL